MDVDPRMTLSQYALLYQPRPGPAGSIRRARCSAPRRRGDLTAFTLLTPYGPNEAVARELVGDLRASAGALAPPAGMTVLVGGGAADVEDVVTGIGAEFPRTAIFILVSTYLVLLLLLRSLLLPLKALAMNTLSIVASFGALVWIFQDGNLSMLFGTRPLGFVETTQPVILFCVLFGLSMDYEVFLLTRMRESWQATGDNPTAVATGLERSGRIVTSAALIVIVVAGSFAFADIVLIKALGVGIAIAVALDATIVRALLVPATMRLLGKWNWWLPGFLERRLPAVEARGGRGVSTNRRRPDWFSRSSPVVAATRSWPTRRSRFHRQPSRRRRPCGPRIPSRSSSRATTVPHDRLTEWWYYTGHLRATTAVASGSRPSIFRAERSSVPTAWASHLALTDEENNRFLYAQRSEIGPQVDRSTQDAAGRAHRLRATKSAASIRCSLRAAPRPSPQPWRFAGGGGRDAIEARLDPAEALAGGDLFGLDLELTDHADPVLHDGDGFVDFGPAGSSYYYSRPRMSAYWHRRARTGPRSTSKASPGSTISGATSCRSAVAGIGSR